MTRRRRGAAALLVLVALVIGVPSSSAGEEGWTLDEISRELMCPQCEMRLDLSTGGAADRVRAFVERRRAEGWTKSQVKEALVAEYGERVLASPPRSGFGGLAWLVPAVIGIGGAVVTALVLVTLRRRPADGPLPAAVPAGGADPTVDGHLDEALRRFDP